MMDMKRAWRRMWRLGGLGLLLGAACTAVPSGDDIVIMRGADGREVAYAVPAASPDAALYADFMIARVASLSDEPAIAASHYARVLKARPDEAPLAERAVFSALIAGDFALARDMAAQAGVGVRNETSLVRLVLGTDALIAGDAAQALRHFRAGQVGPFNRMVTQGLSAWAMLDTEGLAAARREMLAGYSGDALLDGVNSYQIGLLEMAAGEDEAALATFESTWASGVRLAIATEAYARLLAANGRRERAQEIIDVFRWEVGQNPSIEALARALASGEPVEAHRPSVREGAALAIYAPAAALAAQTQDDLAGVYFTLALALDPDLQSARTLWGDALDRAGRFGDAADMLSGVPQDSEFYANARAQLAWVYRRQDRNEEAIATAQDALAYRPDRNLRVQLGDLFRSLERYEEAGRVFTEVIDADAAEGRGGDWRLYYARGTVRERQGRWPEAEADLRRALALSPSQPDVLNYLGYSLVDRGQKLPEAFDMIRQAVAFAPQAGHIVDSLGWAYYRLGQYERAVDELEKAASLLPGDPTISEHLGDAYWQVGRRREAGFTWTRALSLDPEDEAAARIRAKIGGAAPAGPSP